MFARIRTLAGEGFSMTIHPYELEIHEGELHNGGEELSILIDHRHQRLIVAGRDVDRPHFAAIIGGARSEFIRQLAKHGTEAVIEAYQEAIDGDHMEEQERPDSSSMSRDEILSLNPDNTEDANRLFADVMATIYGTPIDQLQEAPKELNRNTPAVLRGRVEVWPEIYCKHNPWIDAFIVRKPQPKLVVTAKVANGDQWKLVAETAAVYIGAVLTAPKTDAACPWCKRIFARKGHMLAHVNREARRRARLYITEKNWHLYADRQSMHRWG